MLSTERIQLVSVIGNHKRAKAGVRYFQGEGI